MSERVLNGCSMHVQANVRQAWELLDLISESSIMNRESKILNRESSIEDRQSIRVQELHPRVTPCHSRMG